MEWRDNGLKIKYSGDGKKVSFIPGHFYEAKKIFDELGEGYAIFDEGEDWYRYGLKFVEENFENVPSENEIDFKMAV